MVKLLMAKKKLTKKIAPTTKFERKDVKIKKGNTTLSVKPAEVKAMMDAKSRGLTNKQIADQHGVAKGTVDVIARSAMRPRLNTEDGKVTLKHAWLRTAIKAADVVEEKIEDLSAKDAAVVAGIATSNFLEMDKKANDVKTKVSPHELASIAKSLTEIKRLNAPKSA